jgi:alginate O-acetyltransferase complex protein AlgI
MLFSSITFLYYFLPCVLFLYFIAPQRLKNTVLLISSLFFYAWGEPYYVLFMLGSICVGYLTGLGIEKYQDTPRAKWILTASVALHVVVLFGFKVSESLPIGISFYTFQVISYMVDVYRKDVPAQKNVLDFATYVSMFPQLIAGPIVRYADIEKQLKNREHSIENAAYGIRRFVLGVSKKVLLANTLGELCEIFRASNDKSILFYWMYAVAFALHVYFDFSGYSDMAIGLGRMMGFRYQENFNYPYISKSITEFWRRWHISLGSWFRDYVYISLGGNRVNKSRYLFNILLVWALTGLWHGGAWNFVVWGLYFAVLLMVEKLWLLKAMERHKVLGHLYAIIIVLIGFVIFDATNLNQAWEYIGAMFGFGTVPMVSAEAVYYLKSYAVIYMVSILGATPLVKSIATRIKKADYFEPILLLGLLIAVTAFLVDGSFNPFLYFRF